MPRMVKCVKFGGELGSLLAFALAVYAPRRALAEHEPRRAEVVASVAGAITIGAGALVSSLANLGVLLRRDRSVPWVVAGWAFGAASLALGGYLVLASSGEVAPAVAFLVVGTGSAGLATAAFLRASPSEDSGGRQTAQIEQRLASWGQVAACWRGMP